MMLAGAVAMPADILAGAGRSGSGLVAGRFVVVCHVRVNTLVEPGFPRVGTVRRQVGCRAMNKALLAAAAALPAVFATPASAQEIFGGVYLHDVETPLNFSGDIEGGTGFQLGFRGAPIRGLKVIGGPSPYVMAQLNSEGNTHFAAAGISWKIGRQIYVRPGIGLAIHTGPGRVVPGDNRIDFGSRILFQPELAVGAQVSERLSVEASAVHFSHATLFSGQNPGMDTFGIRLNYRFR